MILFDGNNFFQSTKCFFEIRINETHHTLEWLEINHTNTDSMYCTQPQSQLQLQQETQESMQCHYGRFTFFKTHIRFVLHETYADYITSGAQEHDNGCIQKFFSM